MTDYFVGTLKECNDLIVKMDAFLGYPNPATKTLTYAKPRQHEKLSGRFFVIIKPVYSPNLERKALLPEMSKDMSVKEKVWVTGETLKAEGAFPKPTLPV